MNRLVRMSLVTGLIAAMAIGAGLVLALSGRADGRIRSLPALSTPASPGGHVLYEPVPPGTTVKLDSEDAVAAARTIGPGGYDRASAIESQLVLFTDTDARSIEPASGGDGVVSEGPLLYAEIPAWIVSLDGLCIPYHGPARGSDATPLPAELIPRPTCAGSELNLVIDANSGEMIQAFSYH
jgi:hypothetical protein